jgi:tetratricopeptide (TPR) repeat protein
MKMTVLITILLSSLTSALASQIDLARIERIHRSNAENKSLLIAQELYRQGLYFAMIPYLGGHIESTQRLTNETERLIEEAVLKTGTNSLAGLSNHHLSRHRSPSLALVLGLKLFHAEKYEDTLRVLDLVPAGHRFGSEAQKIQGSALQLLNRFPEAQQKYAACENISEDLERKARHERLKRYYGIVKESCITHQARLAYKQRNYPEATRLYERISKNSYLWPYLLLERAWSSYYQEDYNRTLGLLVTYRSPLLTSYFFPEAEVLTALAYHQMCLWQDSMKTIEQYHQVYKARSDALRSVIAQHRNSDTYFLQLALSPVEAQDKLNPFIRNLITQIRKKVKFSVDIVNYHAAREELERWRLTFEANKTPLVQQLAREVQRSVQWRTVHLNHFIKEHMFKFLNDVHRFSFELFNIQLEIMSNQRDLLYRNQTLISDRSRGSRENVRRRRDQHFYTFTGEFWADELGDYSFGLQSNCEVVQRTPAQGRK